MSPDDVRGLRSFDRRRWHRVRLPLPVQFGKGNGEQKERVYPYAGQARDITTGGVYLTTGVGGPFAPGDTLTVSIAVPRQARRHFPFSRIIGSCRIVRVEELRATEEGNQTGVALEFCGDRVTILGAL